MTIADRLNEAMMGGDGREPVSQSALFRRSGVPQPTIARILKGKGKSGPETATLVALAQALGVEFLWLQQGTEPKYPGGRLTPSAPVAVSPAQPRVRRHWLPEDEAEFLADYRSLTPASRVRARAVIGSMKRADVKLDDTDEF